MINLKIRNFRVVKEADSEVKRDINILYGSNAGGKSTIISDRKYYCDRFVEGKGGEA